MINNAKLSARKIVFTEYKQLLIPATIYMTLFAIDYLFINVIITYSYWDNFNHLLQLIFLLGFIGLEFICIPLSFVLLYKTIFYLESKSEDNEKLSMRKMFSSKTIIKTIKVNFAPMFLRMLVQTCSARMFYYNRNFMWIAIVASWVDIFISYKLFACNYFIAIESEHPIKSSFRLMNKCFWRYLLLILSFLGYYMIIGCIGVLLQYIITGGISRNLYLPQLKVFNSFGYGIGFFLIPYSFSTYYFWIKQKIKIDNETKDLHNQ